MNLVEKWGLQDPLFLLGAVRTDARRPGLGDRAIEKDYVLTWILLAAVNSPRRGRLAFTLDGVEGAR